MKANEFIKKFGLDSFKAAMLCPQFKRYNYAILYSDEVDFSNELIEKHLDYMFKTADIERLVESHELVIVWRMPESWRGDYNGDKLGLEGARMYLEMHGNYELAGEELDRFKQAIADVESCQ